MRPLSASQPLKKRKKPQDTNLKPPIMPGTPGTMGRGGAAQYMEPAGERADRYPTIPYNLPGQQKRRDYGLDLAKMGVRFENPNGFPVPFGFQEHLYNALLRSPAFASYVSNVGAPRWSEQERGRRGKGGNQSRDPRGHIVFHIGTDIEGWGQLTGNNATGLSPNQVGGIYNWRDVHVRLTPDDLQRFVRADQPRGRGRGVRDVNVDEWSRWLEDAYGEEVLLHEIGHHVDAQLKLSQREEYKTIAKDPRVIEDFGGPEGYGNTMVAENFAVAYQRYVQSPQTRRSMDPRVRTFFDKYVDPLLPHRPDLPRDRRSASLVARRSAQEIHKLVAVARFGFIAGFSEKHIGALLDNYDEVFRKLKKRKAVR